MEENRQLWSAMAHINATIHAGQASLVSPAAAATIMQPTAINQTSSVTVPRHDTEVFAGSEDLSNMLGASPDPMCLAEACGMLFSPALATKISAKQAFANKPRKLFEDEFVTGISCKEGQEGSGKPPQSKLNLCGNAEVNILQ